jgi:hypothetical protein
MSWHYLPVWTRPAQDRVLRLIEVYFDDDGCLNSWTDNPIDHPQCPQGNSVPDMIGDLANMLRDAARWKPVTVEDLKVGMTFDLAEEGPG